jgi:hypothetical protein
MTPDLTSYTNIGAGLFVEITLSGSYIRFSDYNTNVTIDGNLYQGLGKFIGITSSSSELKPTLEGISITITGIPNSSITDIMNANIKGSPIKVLRVFFNATTGSVLSIAGNPSGRFFGLVNNYSLDEEYDVNTRTGINTITLSCSSLTEILENKIAGRKTNPSSFKSYYSTDLSMDRVPSLVNSNFDFGKKT